MKTNAVRLLEEMGIAHELRAYEVDPDDLTAETVADKIGLPAEQVFKTLVARAATATASASRWCRATAGSTGRRWRS
jgi:prolyl-tRNA editing enzyme YbaK/EbsC (Cys-tRNA(Pro) deacylase)